MTVRNALNFIQHDRLSMDKLEGTVREMATDGNSADVSIQNYCPDTEDSNHHASDTSDLKQGFLDLSLLSTKHRSVYIFCPFYCEIL